MRFALALAALTCATLAGAQECITPRPAAPPRVDSVTVTDFPSDGGWVGCKIVAVSPGAPASPRKHAIAAAKCKTAKEMGDQALAIDNGWNDGGTP
jgi:hypothetical protein